MKFEKFENELEYFRVKNSPPSAENGASLSLGRSVAPWVVRGDCVRVPLVGVRR